MKYLNRFITMKEVNKKLKKIGRISFAEWVFNSIKTYFTPDKTKCKGVFNRHKYKFSLYESFVGTGKYIGQQEIKEKIRKCCYTCEKCGNKIEWKSVDQS